MTADRAVVLTARIAGLIALAGAAVWFAIGRLTRGEDGGAWR